MIKIRELKLSPLNEYESADLLLTSTVKPLTLDQLCFPDDGTISLHSAIQMEEKLKKCSGIPEYILILAKLLEYNEWESINIAKEIPNYERRSARHVKSLTQVPKDNLDFKHKVSKNKQKTKMYHNNKSASFSQKTHDKSKIALKHKESKRQRKKREQKEKKLKAKLDSPYATSKNHNKKLRTIHEEEENEKKKSNFNDEESYEDEDQYMEVSPHREENYHKPILKKNITTPEEERQRKTELYHKSQSFTIGEAGDVDQIMKKQLSFNLDPQVEHENIVRKSSRTILKEEKDKRQSIKNKDFIPLRDSQINTLWFQEKPVKNNKDDFNFESLRVPSIEFEQPRMKRRGASHKVSSSIQVSSLDDEGEDLHKFNSDEMFYLKMNKKYISDKNKIIYERQSEDVMSSNLSDSASNKKSRNNDASNDNTLLFLPKIDSEVQRKRVKSWKKSDDLNDDEEEEKVNPNEYYKKKSEEVQDDPYFQDDPNAELVFSYFLVLYVLGNLKASIHTLMYIVMT